MHFFDDKISYFSEELPLIVRYLLYSTNVLSIYYFCFEKVALISKRHVRTYSGVHTNLHTYIVNCTFLIKLINTVALFKVAPAILAQLESRNAIIYSVNISCFFFRKLSKIERNMF